MPVVSALELSEPARSMRFCKYKKNIKNVTKIYMKHEHKIITHVKAKYNQKSLSWLPVVKVLLLLLRCFHHMDYSL